MIQSDLIVDQMLNCCHHWSTATYEVHTTIVCFLIVHAAAIPTNVLPAPHGKTMIPDQALLKENILLKDFSW